VAEHDAGYKSLFSHPEMVEDLLRGFIHEDWVRDLDFSTLKILLPSRVRGVRFPDDLDLEEVKSMIAENGYSWSDRWEREGMEKGLQQGRQEERQEALAKARGVLLRDLERRFGPLPEDFRQRLEAVASIEELTELTLRAGAASSLADLTAP